MIIQSVNNHHNRIRKCSDMAAFGDVSSAWCAVDGFVFRQTAWSWKLRGAGE
jgi:hypothetical protein